MFENVYYFKIYIVASRFLKCILHLSFRERQLRTVSPCTERFWVFSGLNRNTQVTQSNLWANLHSSRWRERNESSP